MKSFWSSNNNDSFTLNLSFLLFLTQITVCILTPWPPPAPPSAPAPPEVLVICPHRTFLMTHLLTDVSAVSAGRSHHDLLGLGLLQEFLTLQWEFDGGSLAGHLPDGHLSRLPRHLLRQTSHFYPLLQQTEGRNEEDTLGICKHTTGWSAPVFRESTGSSPAEHGLWLEWSRCWVTWGTLFGLNVKKYQREILN